MTRRYFIAAAAFAFLGVAAFAFYSWLESHDDRMRLEATLAAQKQAIAAAEARERARAVELRGALDQIAALKRTVRTPEEIVRALPKFLPLPEPITLTPTASPRSVAGLPGQASPPGSAGSRTHQAGKGTEPAAQKGSGPAALGAERSEGGEPGRNQPPASPSVHAETGTTLSAPGATAAAQIPVADLKPLFDFVQDCRACQARLAAAESNLRDEQARAAALTNERDAALRAAKGGGFWTRVKRNAKWLAIGVGVGFAVAHASR